MRAMRLDLSHAHWHKSTHSNGQGGDCLKIAADIPHTVPVRAASAPSARRCS
ncbi:DUF397 domain-containing protein [Streptomyces sp. ECR3]|jgi:hypothetical protein|uniref:DUF397 domain-containing protein n=1 Tax=Streptomyces sp. ECR3 TaxID=3400630 RepID=UPI003F1A3CE3